MIAKSRVFPAALGIYGLLLGPILVIAMISGLSLDAHGFGLIIFSQAIWFIAAGILLLRPGETLSHRSTPESALT
jgi:hypothetical protein